MGLFKSANRILINADVNGYFNIIKKVFLDVVAHILRKLMA